MAAACILVAVGYVGMAARRVSPIPAATGTPVQSEAAAEIQARPHLLFLESQGDADRTVAVAPLDTAADGRVLTGLRCQRVYFASGRGLCVGGFGLGDTYIFDGKLQRHEAPQVSGIPSRARVSPDGRYGAITMFVTGHSYDDASFSTQTTLVDMQTGASLGDLEQFEAYRDGDRFQSPDFNFWGVTFAEDSNRFFATLSTGGRHLLVEGNLAARQFQVLRDGVECPSLSPDGTRIAYKSRIGGSGGRQVQWRLHVLDVATMIDRPLAEERSVDDQVEWWDNQHLVYSLQDEGPPATIRPDLWTLAVDETGPARLLTASAFSPAVVR
jgi:hypothetical protein